MRPESTTTTGKLPLSVARRSNWAPAYGVTGFVSPKAGISMSAPNGAVTVSCSSSPRSIRTAFGRCTEIGIRATSSIPVLELGGGGFA
jgi:hypothetical protein